MPRMMRFARLLRNLFRQRRLDRDLDDELHSHLELLAAEKIRQGMIPEEALRVALIELEGIERIKEVVRGVRLATKLESITQDLRYALRFLRRSPGFAAISILTLAAGIGANTAIFSVVHAVLLQPLPYPFPNRLAIVWTAFGSEKRAPASGPELSYLRERSRSFEEFAGIWVQSAALTGNAQPEEVKVGLVTSNFLSMLSFHPALGRFFLPKEEGAGAPPVVILSESLWRRRFGADPGLVGRSVILAGTNCTVVGVLPRDFRVVFPEGASVPPDVQMFLPFNWDLAKGQRDQGYIRVIGRLRQGLTFAQAQSELETIASQLRSEFAEFADLHLGLQAVPLQGDTVRNVRPALLALFAGVGLVLLIACANVANLLLSRAGPRQKEITLRRALGASRGRIIRQLLTESVVLAGLGGAAAIVVGTWVLRWLLALRPEGIARVGAIELDWSVLAFTAGLSLLTGFLFGLAPALGATRVNLVEALKAAGRANVASKHFSRSLLVVGEVAMGSVLLIGAGLMIRTLASLLRAEPGFDPENVLTFQVTLNGSNYPDAQKAINFLRALEKKIAALPGVISVGACTHLPFDDDHPNWYSYYWPEGTVKDQQSAVMADHRSVLPGYFKSIGATFTAGRDIQETDDMQSSHVVIVDDIVARQAWPNQNPIGKRLNIENGLFVRDWAEVVGVVKHIQYHSLSNSVRGQVFLPYPVAVRANIGFTVRASTAQLSLVEPIRREVSSLDKDLPISKVLPMADYLEKARRETRFTALLSAALAGIALLLACVGIYGVTAYAVEQRTAEIGLRMALGAQRAEILRMILRQGMAPVVSGIVIGLVASAALTPLLSSLLFGVKPIDPATLAASFAFLAASGLIACYLPAWRAMRVAPMNALRYE